MSTYFGVTENMDVDTLAHVVELRQRDGLHVDYQYGIQMSGGNDWEFEIPKPLYNGCSIRMFLYYRQISKAKLRMFWIAHNGTDFVSIEINNGNVDLSYNGLSKGAATNPTGQIATNKFVSLGVRMDGNLIGALIDRYVHPPHEMGYKVIYQYWKMKIYTGANYIVSLHVCEEVGGNFPATGLGQMYTLGGMVLPIGSYVTVFAVFQGGTSDGKTIKISFPQDSPDTAVTHQNAPLNVNDEFRITVRNSDEGWLVTTSYLGDTQDATVVTRKNSRSAQMTNVQVSSNCFIRRILAVCGAVPVQYRHD